MSSDTEYKRHSYLVLGVNCIEAAIRKVMTMAVAIHEGAE
jgi:hypothetical protein